MKKSFAIILSLFLSFFIFSTISAQETSNDKSLTKVYCDDLQVDFNEGPYIIDSTTFVAVRGLSEALDFSYTWDDTTKTVILVSDKITCWVQNDNPTISVKDGNKLYAYKSPKSARIIDGRIFIPLRSICDIFSADINWNSEKSQVEIKSFKKKSEEMFNVSLDLFTPPLYHIKGMSYTLYGEINSNTLIDRVNVKIKNAHTDEVYINETIFNVNSKKFLLSHIDNKIKFGLLDVGDKSLIITMVDENEIRKEFIYDFIVKNPEMVDETLDIKMLWPVPTSGLLSTIFWCDNEFCHSNSGREIGHGAIDIADIEGARVIAVADGIIKMCGEGTDENHKNGYGNFVLIDHGDGLETQYSHLLEIKVEPNQIVKAGDLIGLVGSTGASTGNHLDFYISKDGERLDPLYYLNHHEDIRCMEDCDQKYLDICIEKMNEE